MASLDKEKLWLLLGISGRHYAVASIFCVNFVDGGGGKGRAKKVMSPDDDPPRVT